MLAWISPAAGVVVATPSCPLFSVQKPAVLLAVCLSPVPLSDFELVLNATADKPDVAAGAVSWPKVGLRCTRVPFSITPSRSFAEFRKIEAASSHSLTHVSTADPLLRSFNEQPDCT